MCNFRITRYNCYDNTGYIRVGPPCPEAAIDGPCSEASPFSTVNTTQKEWCCTEQCCIEALESKLLLEQDNLLDKTITSKQYLETRRDLTAKHESVCKPQQARNPDLESVLQLKKTRGALGNGSAPITVTLAQRNAHEDVVLKRFDVADVRKAREANHERVTLRTDIRFTQMQLDIERRNAEVDAGLIVQANLAGAAVAQEQAANAHRNACIEYAMRLLAHYHR